MNASIGYGNYNALFITLKSQDWHGVTMQSNFTWSKALGTGAEVQATSEATAARSVQPQDRLRLPGIRSPVRL